MQGNNFVSIYIPVELVFHVSVHIEEFCALLEETVLKYKTTCKLPNSTLIELCKCIFFPMEMYFLVIYSLISIEQLQVLL